MTKEEILAMKAGTELDALVAEQILGWHKVMRDEPLGDCTYKWKDKSGTFQSCQCFFQPFSDISDTWQVVDELINKKEKITEVQYKAPPIFSLVMGSYPAPWCLASFAGCQAGGDTAPEAICKAALLTKYSTENT